MKSLIMMFSVIFFTLSNQVKSESITDPIPVHPSGQISNGLLNVSFYIPDAAKGYYRGTRFDWSGIIYSLRYKNEEYYGRWFTRLDPSIHNNVQRVGPDGSGEVVCGIASSGQGPAEEFLTNDKALGFDNAKPGETFLKIGVGVLRRPDDKPYDRYRDYEIVDGGKWTTNILDEKVVFTQTLSNQESGYGYVYTKTISLIPGKPVMRIEHQLLNKGIKALISSVYDHNFFVTNNHHTGPDYIITMPYPLKISKTQGPDLFRIDGNKLLFTKLLSPREMVVTWIDGFAPVAKDYKFRVENSRTGTGYSVQGDRPLAQIMLWAIFTNISLESFIDLNAGPGREERWAYEYTYFTGVGID